MKLFHKHPFNLLRISLLLFSLHSMIENYYFVFELNEVMELLQIVSNWKEIY